MRRDRARTRRRTPFALSMAVALTLHAAFPQPSRAAGDLRAMSSRQTLLILAAGGALTAVSLRLDDPGRAETLLDRAPFEGPSDVGNRYGDSSTLAAGALGLMAVGALTGKDVLRVAGWDLTRSLLYSGAAVWALKLAVSRTRPNGGAYSFPSGHAASAFAAAPVLASHFGVPAAIPAFAFAAAAGLGRMEDRKHYLSDVVVGATIGLAVGTSVVRSSAGRSNLNFGVTPDGIACTLRF